MRKQEKVLFVNPPMIFFSAEELRAGSAPIRPNVSVPALLVLGELKGRGYENHFIDMVADGRGKVTKIRENTYMLGMDFKELEKKVRGIRPDYFLVGSMFTIDLRMVEKTAETLKKVFPRIPVIVGGSFASAMPKRHLECRSIDFVVVGEGEKTTPSLIEAIRKGDYRHVDGVLSREAPEVMGSYRHSEEYRPVFDYESVLFDGKRYRYPAVETRKSALYTQGAGKGERACAFYGSKGCPMGCDYCSALSREGSKIRHMGGDRLFGEIRKLHEEYGVTVFYNQSDTFGFHPEDRKFLRKLSRYRKLHPGLSLSNPNAFFVRIFFRDGATDRDFISLLKSAGFSVITLAIETFIQRFNKKIDFSEITFGMIKDLCRHIKSSGMKVDIYFMLGFPGQTMKELEDDVRKMNELAGIADEVSWGNMILFPGTKYYSQAIREGWFTEEEYLKNAAECYSYGKISDFFNFTEIPTKSLEEIFRNRSV
jgi:anaerobic magnesium-protoporphyrin IX monomethyl ester cyclase